MQEKCIFILGGDIKKPKAKQTDEKKCNGLYRNMLGCFIFLTFTHHMY